MFWQLRSDNSGILISAATSTLVAACKLVGIGNAAPGSSENATQPPVT